MCNAPARLLIVLPALLGLAACGSSAREDVLPTPVVDPAFSATTLETPGVPISQVSRDAAFVRLPSGAGNVVAVRERRYVNGASQQIVLDGERVRGIENRLDISVQTQAEGGRADLYVPMSPPSEAGIAAELADRFPNMTMQVSQKQVANSYGPYGLAIGRDGATRCVYVWQWIDDLNSIRPGQVSLLQRLSLTSGASAAPASIRIRLCRRDASLDQLAGYVGQMVIGTVQTLNRLLAQGGAANTGSADRRVAFETPGPARPTSLEAELGGGRVASPPTAVASAPARSRTARRTPRPTETEQPQQPVYAPPPVAGAPPQYGAPVQPGARYLAPVQGAGGGQYRNMPAQGAPYSAAPAAPYGAAPRPPSAGLDPTLPPQAYQGPRASQQRPPGY